MSLSIKAKLLILAIVPTITIVVTLNLMFMNAMNTQNDSQSGLLKKSLIEESREKLTDLMTMAYGSIKNVYETGGSMEDGVAILKNLEFGDSGYIFGYDSKAIRVFSGSGDAGIGNSYWDTQDENGVY